MVLTMADIIKFRPRDEGISALIDAINAPIVNRGVRAVVDKDGNRIRRNDEEKRKVGIEKARASAKLRVEKGIWTAKLLDQMSFFFGEHGEEIDAQIAELYEEFCKSYQVPFFKGPKFLLARLGELVDEDPCRFLNKPTLDREVLIDNIGIFLRKLESEPWLEDLYRKSAFMDHMIKKVYGFDGEETIAFEDLSKDLQTAIGEDFLIAFINDELKRVLQQDAKDSAGPVLTLVPDL